MPTRTFFGPCGYSPHRASPAFAHHSFGAEYDSAKPVSLTGVVTKIDWSNPHVYIYLEVKDNNGQLVNWALEGHPPNTLRRTGWTRAALKENDTITVTGWMSKDGSNRIAGREVTLAGRPRSSFWDRRRGKRSPRMKIALLLLL